MREQPEHPPRSVGVQYLFRSPGRQFLLSMTVQAPRGKPGSFRLRSPRRSSPLIQLLVRFAKRPRLSRFADLVFQRIDDLAKLVDHPVVDALGIHLKQRAVVPEVLSRVLLVEPPPNLVAGIAIVA